jgi:hypothetical protein
MILIKNKINSLIHLINNGLYRAESVQKSVHGGYTISGIPDSHKNKKPQKRFVSGVSKSW